MPKRSRPLRVTLITSGDESWSPAMRALGMLITDADIRDYFFKQQNMERNKDKRKVPRRHSKRV